MIPMEFYLVFAGILFCLGLYGMMTTDKALVALMSVELMLNAANVNFITFAAYHVGADATIGNIFVLMSIAIAAAEVAVGIALILNAYKIRGSSSTDDLTTMRW